MSMDASLERRIIVSTFGEAAIAAGVGRGCPLEWVLSPLLWAIFVDELLDKLAKEDIHCFI